jgi:hypothetical protein
VDWATRGLGGEIDCAPAPARRRLLVSQQTTGAGGARRRQLALAEPAATCRSRAVGNGGDSRAVVPRVTARAEGRQRRAIGGDAATSSTSRRATRCCIRSRRRCSSTWATSAATSRLGPQRPALRHGAGLGYGLPIGDPSTPPGTRPRPGDEAWVLRDDWARSGRRMTTLFRGRVTGRQGTTAGAVWTVVPSAASSLSDGAELGPDFDVFRDLQPSVASTSPATISAGQMARKPEAR